MGSGTGSDTLFLQTFIGEYKTSLVIKLLSLFVQTFIRECKTSLIINYKIVVKFV